MNPWNLIPWSISIIALIITILTFAINRKKDVKAGYQEEDAKFDGIKERQTSSLTKCVPLLRRREQT